MIRIHFSETVSTNTFLKTYAREGGSPYVLCTADYQSAGRGQRGNSWESDRGCNLLFTLAHYEPPVTPSEQFLLSEAIALAIIDMLRRRCPEQADAFRIKWPNDIYYQDQKLAGILIEHELTGSAIQRTLIGVGLNINQPAFHSDAPNPVSLLQITGRTHDREDILTDILATYDTLIHHTESLPDAYHAHLYRRNIPALYRDAEGEFRAVLEGVEPNGLLRLRREDNTIRHYAFKEVAYVI